MCDSMQIVNGYKKNCYNQCLFNLISFNLTGTCGRLGLKTLIKLTYSTHAAYIPLNMVNKIVRSKVLD
jgi:hypothetical protein